MIPFANIQALDTLHQGVAKAVQDRDYKEADRLMALCDNQFGECSICGVICCPHGEPMHFHHDGCPSCAAPEPYTQEQVDIMNEALERENTAFRVNL